MGATSEIVDVLTYGARKYAPDNWRHVANPQQRYYAAAMRHIVAWVMGEKLDPESGKPHLAHAAGCLLFLLEFDGGPDGPAGQAARGERRPSHRPRARAQARGQ